MSKRKQLTEQQLAEWQQRLEQDTKRFQWIMSFGIIGGFAMVSALGIWVYLAYIL